MKRGLCAVEPGLAGYLLKKASWLERILFIAGGLALLMRILPVEIAGIAILAVTILIHWRRKQAGKLL